MKAAKIILVDHWSRVYALDKKVVPTVHATGILWIITETVKTARSSSLSNTPIANPSIKLWRIIASPNETIVEVSTL